MRITIGVVLACLGAVLVAQADELPPTPATPSATTAAVAPPGTETAVTEDPAKLEAQAKRAAEEAKIKKSGFGGYKPETHGSTTVYCHSEAAIGSRFETKTCRTLEQLLAQQKQGQDMGNDIFKSGLGVRSRN